MTDTFPFGPTEEGVPWREECKGGIRPSTRNGSSSSLERGVVPGRWPASSSLRSRRARLCSVRSFRVALEGMGVAIGRGGGAMRRDEAKGMAGPPVNPQVMLSGYLQCRVTGDGGDVMRRGAAGPVRTQKLTDEERVNPALAVSTYTVCKDVR